MIDVDEEGEEGAGRVDGGGATSWSGINRRSAEIEFRFTRLLALNKDACGNYGLPAHCPRRRRQRRRASLSSFVDVVKSRRLFNSGRWSSFQSAESESSRLTPTA